jgi:hypothetical protein
MSVSVSSMHSNGSDEPLSLERITAFCGALGALGDRVIAQDRRTIAVAGAVLEFHSDVVVVRNFEDMPTLRARIVSLGRIFNVKAVDAQGVSLADVVPETAGISPAPKQEAVVDITLAPVPPVSAALHVLNPAPDPIDELLAACSRLKRRSDGTAQLAIAEVASCVTLGRRLVRIRFHAFPTEEQRIPIGGALVQRQTFADAHALATRVSLPAPPPP